MSITEGNGQNQTYTPASFPIRQEQEPEDAVDTASCTLNSWR